jgi:hypothetical protein
VTRDEWEQQAIRIGSAWPTPPMDDTRRDVYYDVLHDLPIEAVEKTVSALLREARETVPAPGVIRAHAEQVAMPVSAQTPTVIPGLPSPQAPAVRTPAAADAPMTGKRSDQEEREGRRPWLGVLFGILGIFPLALWFGIRSLIDRKHAVEAGRKPAGDTWAALTAILLGTIALMVVPIGIAYALSDTNPNGGTYLTRAELEGSIKNQGVFGSDEQQVRVTEASCVEDSSDGSKYRCLVTFRGGIQQSYQVTVGKDGSWVAS